MTFLQELVVKPISSYHRLLMACMLIGLLAPGISCTRLKFDRTLSTNAHDWPTFGRDNHRSNNAPETLTPPLVKAWEHDVTGGIGTGSPLLVDSFVFIGNLRGELYGIHLYTGKRKGWISLGDAIEGSPVISGNIAYVAVLNSGESLLAYDLSDGRVVWRRDYGEIQVSLLLSERKIFFGTTSGKFYCVEQERGDLVWEFPIPHNIHRKGIRSSAASSSETVVFGCDDGNLYALTPSRGKLLWTFSSGAPIVAPASIYNNIVICCNLKGQVFALNLSTGEQLWQAEEEGSIYASPGFVKDTVLVATTAGIVTSRNIADGSLNWRQRLNSVINTSPVVSGSVAYIGTMNRQLVAVSTVDGSVLWKTELPGRVKTTPAIGNGHLIVATDAKLVLAWKEPKE